MSERNWNVFTITVNHEDIKSIDFGHTESPPLTENDETRECIQSWYERRND